MASIIAKSGNYSISSSFGTSIVEGSVKSGTDGPGAGIFFTIDQTTPTVSSFYWRIEPLSGQTTDFWDMASTKAAGGAPADQAALSGFGVSAAAIIDADTTKEANETFQIAFYASAADPGFGIAPLISASFTIVDDDTRLFAVVRSGVSSTMEPTVYSGPVAWLQWQCLGTDAAETVTGTEGNDFLNLLGGNDAANGGAGRDVVDGGGGSNFLTGGPDQDVFFLDGRNLAPTWSTITDWENGEQLSVWGWKPGVSKVTWVEGAGAPGWTGVTMHADLNGDGTIDTSVTWTGMTRALVPSALEYDGLLWIK